MPTIEPERNGLSPRCVAALQKIDRLVDDGQPIDRAALIVEFADVAEELCRHFEIMDLLDACRQCERSPVGDRAPERPIESFGDYEVLDELGRGGMAVVYKARQKSLDRLVALKFPHGGALATAAAAERFRQEALALARLRHPNIVAIHEVGEHAGRTYLSMEYVEGTDLAKLLRDEPPSIRQAVEHARTIAAAISYAHEQGIVHRDLKPANIMVDRAGAVRIADFGLGKILAVDHSLTQTGQILGTLRYMPPEHADGDNDRAPEAGDIYAIGAILYELLSGRPAFWANSTGALIRQIFEQDPIPLRQLDRKIPDDLETICLKCLNKNPAERYATAGALAEDLQRFLDGQPITARSLGRIERCSRWCRRRPVIAALCGVTAVSIAATILTAFWSWQAAIRSRQTAITAKQLAEKNVIAETRLAQRSQRDAAIEQLQRIRQAAHTAGWSRRCMELIADAAEVERSEQLSDEFVACLAGVDGALVHSWDFRSSSVAISDDGRQLLLGGGIAGNTRSWNAETKAFVESSQPGFGPVTFAANGDGVQWLAESPTSFMLWNVTRQTAICRVGIPLTEDPAPTTDAETTARLLDRVTLCMSRDAMLLAASAPAMGSASGSPRQGATFVWTADGQLLLRIENEATALRFSPDHALLAVGREDGRVDLIRIADGNLIVTLQERINRIHGLDFMVDPKHDGSDRNWLLAAGDAGGVVTVWDVGRRHPRSRCLGSEWDVHVVRFSPDGMTLATAGRDGARLWDYMTGRMILRLRTIGDHASELAFTRDGQHLAVSSRGSAYADADPYSTTVWSLKWGRGVDLLNGLSVQIPQTSISFDGRHVAALGQNWDVGVYELHPARLKYILQAPVGEYADNAAMVISRDNRWLAVSTGSEVRVFELESGALVNQYRLPPGLVDQLAFTPDGKLLSLRWESEDGQSRPFVAGKVEAKGRLLRLRNLSGADSLTPVAEIRHFEGRVIKGAAHPEGRFFIVEGQLRFGDHKIEEIVAFDGITGSVVWKHAPEDPEVWPVLDPIGSTLIYRCWSDDASMQVDLPSGITSTMSIPHVVALGPGAHEWLTLDSVPNRETRGLTWHRRGAARRIALLGSDFKPHNSSPRFSRDGRMATFGTTEGLVVVCDLPEIERRLAEFENAQQSDSQH